MERINFNKCEFIKSAAESSQFIRSSIPSIVFAGKSNVGKSSVINRILNRNNFARVGNKPGKTIHINYFLIDNKLYFVDLPGYGFANVSKSERSRWADLMESYFSIIDIITFGVLIVDARHKPTNDDIKMNDYFKSNNIPYVVVANKIDKLKSNDIAASISDIIKILEVNNLDVIPFSAEKGTGKELLISKFLEFC